MGIRNYLIEGVSGAGKTAVAEELERRRFHVVHGDRELAHHGDPDTGEPAKGPSGAGESDAVRWRHQNWIWDADKVRSLVADQSQAATFFCGGSRNHRRYIGLFDKVFVLDVDLDTLKLRVSARGEDEFGATPAEWVMLARLHATKEGIPENAVSIDATRPLTRVVDEILSHCGHESADET